jgi:pimeloyl-ACP methyl ester carboxylesterase
MNLAEFVAANLSRATGAGLDPHEYLRRTAALTTPRDWLDAFVDTGEEYLRRAASATSLVTAAAYYGLAARWFHVATLRPSTDLTAQADAEARADEAMGRSLAVSEPAARRVAGPLFTGWLRGPAEPVATVVVVPGMDSSKEEFHLVVEALLRRGAAVFAMDGPGQGVLAPTSRVRADYHHVMDQVVTALGVERIGLVGLSLGGYYAARTAAQDPRVAAAVTVSGPFRLDWPHLPPIVQEVLAQRAGSIEAAHQFAEQIDLAALAPNITAPVLVIDGGQDIIPGVINGEPLARLAPSGEYRRLEHGDHLLGNAQPDWLPPATDWLLNRLTAVTT